MGWKSRHSDGRHFRTKHYYYYDSNQSQRLNLITIDRAEATVNAKIMLERFNQTPNREQQVKIKRALVYAANTISKQGGNKDVVESYRAVVAKMVLPPKEKPMSFRKKTIRKTKVLGLEVKKETEETQMSHVPSVIIDEKAKSRGVDIKYGLVGIGGSLAESEKTTFKVPKEKKKPNRRKKQRAYV